MYRIPKWKVMLVREGSDSTEQNQFANPAEVAAFAAPLFDGADREMFIILLLNTKNKVTGSHIVSIGTLNANLIHPREVYKAAVVGNAAAIILLHNHPSGDPTPSMEDLEVTKRVIEAGKIMGIKVLDHVVIGEGRYFSWKEKALLDD